MYCKLFSSLFIAAAILLAPQVSRGQDFVRGDTTLVKGTVDNTDAIVILIYLFVNSSFSVIPDCLDAADVNDDENVDISDAIVLLTWLNIGGPPPPSPTPNVGFSPYTIALSCGPDPSGTLLDCVSFYLCP